METPEVAKKNSGDNGVWRYLTAVFASLLIGILTGQFIPNRNVVTTDQLNAAVAPLKEEQVATNRQLTDMRDKLNELTGELKARDVISKTP